MPVIVIDLSGKDSSAAVSEIDKVVEQARSQSQAVTAMSLLPGGAQLAVVCTPLATPSGAAEELEGFKRLLDSGAISVFDFNDAKKRLIERL